MKSATMHVVLTLMEPLLGTTPGNKEIATEFIASNHPDGPQDDEVEAAAQIEAAEEIEKKSTFLPRDADGNPFMWDYQIKGFFKDACSMLRRTPKAKSKDIKAYKKIIDGLIFPTPRQIPIILNGDVSFIERPLRAQTPQGERVTLARSEAAPLGSTIELDINYLDPALKGAIIEWLDYGELRGLGQWRNSGMGRFTYEIC